MGRVGLIGVFWVIALAGAIAPRPAWSSSAMPTMIAHVQAALDRDDAQLAASLAQAIITDRDYSAAPERLTALDTLRPGRATSARLTPVNALALRPALDQSDLHASGSGGAQVQLGAWRSAAKARAGWGKAKARAGGTLDGLSPRILVAELPGKGRYYRLRVSPGRSGAELCVCLAARAVPCFPVRD
jgi:hypothetical protein